MKLTVFGATGQTGVHVLKEALQRGYQVTALVRTTTKVDSQLRSEYPERLRLVEGDLLDQTAVDLALEGADALVFAAGPVKGGNPDMPYLAAKTVVASAKAAGVKRLVWLLGAAVLDPRDKPDFARKIVRLAMKLTARQVLESSERAYQHLVESGLDYTVVRPPILTNNPGRGPLNASYQPPKPKGISRTDLGRFMVDMLSDEQWRNQSPMVSYA